MKYGIVLLLGIVGVSFWYFFSIKYKRVRFKCRRDIGELDFYQMFITEKKESILTLPQVNTTLRYIAKYIHVSWKKMRPNDLLYFYGPEPGWDYDDELNDILLIFRDKLTSQNSLADLIEVIWDAENSLQIEIRNHK